MFQAQLCPSSGARDYTEGYGMRHMTHEGCNGATSLIPEAQSATRTNGQPTQGVMCQML